MDATLANTIHRIDACRVEVKDLFLRRMIFLLRIGSTRIFFLCGQRFSKGIANPQLKFPIHCPGFGLLVLAALHHHGIRPIVEVGCSNVLVDCL